LGDRAGQVNPALQGTGAVAAAQYAPAGHACKVDVPFGQLKSGGQGMADAFSDM
jgi:hypothetical protein